MDQPDSLTLRWTQRSRLGDGRYCTFVIDIETLEASLHFEDEASSPIEFFLDNLRFPSGRVAHPGDSGLINHLTNALRSTSVTDFEVSAADVSVTTAWTGSASRHIHANGMVTSGPIVTWTYEYSGQAVF